MGFNSATYVVDRNQLSRLFSALHHQGYTVIGPTRNQAAILYHPIETVDELPIGWTDSQDPGTYRLSKQDTPMLFNYVVSQHSWKKYLYPHVRNFLSVEKNGKGFAVKTPQSAIRNQQFAFVGVRACELNAIRIQDKVFATPPYTDTYYAEQRKSALIIAVNCSTARNNCFCTSMQTGPRITPELSADLVLTEIYDNNQHRFLIEVGSNKGAALLKSIPQKSALPEDKTAADKVVSKTISQISRNLDTTDIKNLLYRNLEHPHWQEIAQRCLTCGNCTMVCPTCFCSTVEDATDLTGTHADRKRVQDVCFSMEFSYIHGGSVRPSPAARYRQWMTHKLAYWLDQFGVSGCVGCGRCITWCPVGIDITEETRFFRDAEKTCAK
ncbi:MAG: 4Fe-4S dicluster domain-containing protein [bacterium]